MTSTQTLIDGLAFGEGPRWRDNKLWFSDMHAKSVCTVDLAGNFEIVLTLEDDEPSGLGWLPDGRLLIVSMRKRQLLVAENGGINVLADIHHLASYHCNDMVTDNVGRSYVGNFGFDLHSGAKPSAGELVLVEPDGEARIVAEGLKFPNGTVISPDGTTLIVGESMGACLTAFDIEADGSLSNRRLWAEMEGALPDGICLDAENGIWVASPISNEALRIVEGGEVTDRIKVENQAFACMLGGPDGKTLFIMTSISSSPQECIETRSAAVEFVEVLHPRAGLP